MPHVPMQYYLLTHEEAELIACFRMMSEPAQDAVASMVASQAMPGRSNLATPVKLSLVSNT